jgi:hypothetical protein
MKFAPSQILNTMPQTLRRERNDGFPEADWIRLWWAWTARRALSLLAGESRRGSRFHWWQRNHTLQLTFIVN